MCFRCGTPLDFLQCFGKHRLHMVGNELMKLVISNAVLLLDGHSGSFQFVQSSNVCTFRAYLLDPAFMDIPVSQQIFEYNPVITGLDRRELELVIMFGKEERDKDGALNVALCALSTPVLLVTDSPAQLLLQKAGGIAGPFLWCPPVLTQQIASWSKAPLKEAHHLVSGADQYGHRQQFRSGVTLPEAWAGADSYVRKACLQLSVPVQGLSIILPGATTGQ